MIKTYPSFEEEKLLWDRETLVIGVDEVGRGAFAGPIVAAGVVFSPNFSATFLDDVNDSKQVRPLLRSKLSKLIRDHALFYSIAQVDVATINHVGIGKANNMAFRIVVKDILEQAKNLKNTSDFRLLVDGFQVKYISQIGLEHQKGIIKGDQKSFSIAAASILAKVHRDSIMKKYHKTYPVYLFGKNKGYGTAEHQDALREFGLTKLHRYAFCKSYAKVC